MQERIQCLVKHVQLRGWRGTQGSQKSWVSRVPESPSSVFEAKAARGARKRQLWGWRSTQGRQGHWAGLGPKASLCVGKMAAGSGKSWRAMAAVLQDGCPARSESEWPLGVLWAPTKAEDHGRGGSTRRLGESAH